MAAPAVRATATAAITWTDCRDGFQCATVRLPLDYGQPGGAQISLALIRLPAFDGAHRKGSLFLNPGGPGGSGVADVRGSGKSYPAAIRRQFDVVGFDPRGIGASTPLLCFTGQKQADAATHRSKFPVTVADERQWKQVDQLFAADCAANAGRIIDHMSTADVARDLDVLRRMVGDRLLNYVGFSYGSVLGQTYANMYPQNVGAFVIDGVLDPVAWSTGQARQSRTIPFTTRIGSAAAGELSLGQFFSLCDLAGQACAFSGDSRSRFDALAERLRKKPVEYPGAPGFFVDYAGLIGLAASSMYRPASWVGLAEDLAALETSAAASPSAAAAEATGRRLPPANADYAPFEQYYGVICSDTVNPTHYDAWIRNADRVAVTSPYFGRLWNWTSSVCSIWPGQDDDRYLGPWNRTTANPVLVVGNFYDPATPYTGAQAAARLLPGSRLLSYAGWGHQLSLLEGNACLTTAMVGFLVAGILPPAGKVCQPTSSPFAPTAG